MTDERFYMRSTLGAHKAYARDGQLVVDWYDFGDDAPYESGNLLIFDQGGMGGLAVALGLPRNTTAAALAKRVAKQFDSFFEVRAFADLNKIAYAHEVDFFR